MCGPTASGKSELSDALADALSRVHDAEVPTIAVDSMQVYREIPAITNQARRRSAELVGIVPVTEEWTVARHRSAARELVAGTESPFVLDAGTGMYLNAIVLDVPLAPRVEPGTRLVAQGLTADSDNPRRDSRQKELELAGAPERGSIWDGELAYDVALIYLRLDPRTLDAAIQRRSEAIATQGLAEARLLASMRKDGARISVSVLDAIGVRELLLHLSGDLTIDEATSRIATRTRQLARRQRRWFDKLARTVDGRARTFVLDQPADTHTMHNMVVRGRIWS